MPVVSWPKLYGWCAHPRMLANSDGNQLQQRTHQGEPVCNLIPHLYALALNPMPPPPSDRLLTHLCPQTILSCCPHCHARASPSCPPLYATSTAQAQAAAAAARAGGATRATGSSRPRRLPCSPPRHVHPCQAPSRRRRHCCCARCRRSCQWCPGCHGRCCARSPRCRCPQSGWQPGRNRGKHNRQQAGWAPRTNHLQHCPTTHQVNTCQQQGQRGLKGGAQLAHCCSTPRAAPPSLCVQERPLIISCCLPAAAGCSGFLSGRLSTCTSWIPPPRQQPPHLVVVGAVGAHWLPRHTIVAAALAARPASNHHLRKCGARTAGAGTCTH